MPGKAKGKGKPKAKATPKMHRNPHKRDSVPVESPGHTGPVESPGHTGPVESAGHIGAEPVGVLMARQEVLTESTQDGTNVQAMMMAEPKMGNVWLEEVEEIDCRSGAEDESMYPGVPGEDTGLDQVCPKREDPPRLLALLGYEPEPEPLPQSAMPRMQDAVEASRLFHILEQLALEAGKCRWEEGRIQLVGRTVGTINLLLGSGGAWTALFLSVGQCPFGLHRALLMGAPEERQRADELLRHCQQVYGAECPCEHCVPLREGSLDWQPKDMMSGADPDLEGVRAELRAELRQAMAPEPEAQRWWQPREMDTGGQARPRESPHCSRSNARYAKWCWRKG